jgi:hypothetical protein
MNLVRGAKGLALLSLLLPLVTVSCGPGAFTSWRTSWSGLDLMSGQLPAPPPLPGIDEAALRSFSPPPDLFLIGIAAALALALAATFMLPRKPAAVAGLGTAVAAAAVLYYDIVIRMPPAVYHALLDAGERVGGRSLGRNDEVGLQMLQSALRVEPAQGFWLAMAALLAAIALCVSVLNRERGEGGEPGG